MEKHADYSIKKRKDGRYAVAKRGGGYINGQEKLKILVDAGLVKAKLPQAEPDTANEGDTAPAES